MVNKISITLLMLVSFTAAYSQVEFKNGGKAKVIERYSDGAIKSEGYYRNGSKYGKWIH
ncbi:MAG: hypothetical protein JKX73_09900 [Flavobacteriales bacterium]|nr:hypothetical protein [Flavobacteriales bacterium]